LVEECADLASSVQRHISPRVALETFLIRACRETLDTSLSRVIERMADLERRLADAPPHTGGTFQARPVRSARPRDAVDQAEPSAPDVAEPEVAPPATEFAETAPGAAGEWDRILAAVETLGNFTLRSLLTHVAPVGVEGDSYVVEVGPTGEFFRKSLIKREYKRLIEGKIAEILGRTLQFVCRMNKNLAIETAPAKPAPAPPVHVPQPQPVQPPPVTEPGGRGTRGKKKGKEPATFVSAEDREKVSGDEDVRRLIDLFDGTLTTVRKLDLKGET
jgi:hypothetical protein